MFLHAVDKGLVMASTAACILDSSESYSFGMCFPRKSNMNLSTLGWGMQYSRSGLGYSLKRASSSFVKHDFHMFIHILLHDRGDLDCSLLGFH